MEVDPDWEPLPPAGHERLQAMELKLGRLEARVEGERFKGPSAALLPWIALMLITPGWFVELLSPFGAGSALPLALFVALSAFLWILAERSVAKKRAQAEEMLEGYEALAARHPDWTMTPWGDRADRHKLASRPPATLYLSIVGVGALQLGDLFMDLGLEWLAWGTLAGVLVFLLWAILSHRRTVVHEEEHDAIDRALKVQTHAGGDPPGRPAE